MQLFRIRGTFAFLAAFIVGVLALAVGAPGWAAILVGIVVGPTLSWIILSWGPLARTADRTDRWLETPRFPKR